MSRVVASPSPFAGHNDMITARVKTLFTAIALWTIALPSPGAIWHESGDAGGTPATAQITHGLGSLDTIQGSVDPASDVDVFSIRILDPALFSIGMVGTALSGDNDTTLYVLDNAGNLIFSDEDSGPGLLAQVDAGSLAGYSPGVYLVAYSVFGSTPNGAEPVLGWGFDPAFPPAQTGKVQLNLTESGFAIPLPAGIWLFGSALAALGGFRIRRGR